MAKLDEKKGRIALILILLAAFIAIAGLDLYAERRSGKTRQIYEESYNTEAGDSVKFSPSGEVVTVRSRENGLRKYKYYRVSGKDNTFLRSMLAARAWNLICFDENIKRDYDLTLLRVDDDDIGLFMKSQEPVYSTTGIYGITPAEVYESAQEMGKSERIIDYLLFLQLTYAYKNITEDYAVTEDSSFSPAIAPERVEYAFGILPGAIEYLGYKGESRVITPAEYGIEDEASQQTLYRLMSERWRQLRETKLTNEALFEELGLYEQALVDSGYIEKSGFFSSDDDFTAADYYRDSVDRMKGYVSLRLEELDRYYEEGADIELSARFVPEKPGSDDASDENPGSLKENQGYFEDAALKIPGTEEEIRLYVLNNKGYFFLPSFTDADEAQKCFESSLGPEDKATIEGLDGIEYLRSENISATFVETFNGTMDYINDAKGHHEPGYFRCFGPEGEPETEGALVKIKGKGHSSFSHSDKKSYTICFDSPVSIEQLGSGDTFILQANALDKTRIRNTLAYRYARELGIDHTTGTRYTDLYLNGRYWGTYEYLEAVAKGDACAAAGEYLFEINNDEERSSAETCFRDSENTQYEIDYPSEASEALLTDMSAWMDEKIDVVNRCSQMSAEALNEEFDVDSFASMYIMDALFDDVDANFVSTFYRRNAENKLLAGPVWDYDLTLGNHGKREVDHGINSFADGLPERLMASSQFRKTVRSKWDSIGRAAAEELVTVWADETAEEIGSSLSMDRIRWLYEERTSADDRDHADAVEELKNFAGGRIEIIDRAVE